MFYVLVGGQLKIYFPSSNKWAKWWTLMAHGLPAKAKQNRRIQFGYHCSGGIFLQRDGGLQDSWSRLTQILSTNPQQLLNMEAFHTTKGSQLSKCKLMAQGCSARATPDILSGLSYQLVTGSGWASDQPLYFPQTGYLRLPYLTTNKQLQYTINLSLGQDQKKTMIYICKFSKTGWFEI